MGAKRDVRASVQQVDTYNIIGMRTMPQACTATPISKSSSYSSMRPACAVTVLSRPATCATYNKADMHAPWRIVHEKPKVVYLFCASPPTGPASMPTTACPMAGIAQTDAGAEAAGSGAVFSSVPEKGSTVFSSVPR